MKPNKVILLIDLIVNLLLGVLLLAYSERLAAFIGVPVVESSFYPNILGGVFMGISLALLLELLSGPGRKTPGLGLTGAIAINLCGGFVLLLWLIFGNLALPAHGLIFLWSLAVILVVISSLELYHHLKIGK